ncbi:MAG TPA: penicillin-binding protein 2 [Polyangiales bacterium]|nr:penicillin-binding protein 2 [Polyangiales bacterium]
MNLLSVSREVGEFRKRYRWMALGVAFAFGLLFARVLYLQVLDYNRYAAIASENILKTQSMPATRGIIRDTAGRVIAQNRPAYRLFITPSKLRGEDDLSNLIELLQLDEQGKALLRAQLEKVPDRRRAHQVQVLGELTRDQLAAVETHARDLPAVELIGVPVRDYTYGKLGAHAVGYLNEISAEELTDKQQLGYRAGDTIGRSGLERAWETLLRGQRGKKRVYVDARGRKSKLTPRGADEQQEEEPVPGRDLTLTLDMELMRSIEHAFRGHPSGAAVVVDVHNGQVRALFSKPSYDLNEMSGKLSQERADELFENPFRPLIDKTLFETYYPGSTFKPVSALAALTDGIVDEHTEVTCGGVLEMGNRRFRCEHVHGRIAIKEALMRSCNIYFYKLGEAAGIDRIARMAFDFGLGEKTGIGINTEAKGQIPTKAWYEERGEPFRIGYSLNTAIGQGDTRVSLMQLALAYAAIANGGTLYVPQVVESVNAPDGSLLERFAPQVRRKTELSPLHLKLVHEALTNVVNKEGGTAYDPKYKDGIVAVAGKTGTAQVEQHLRDKSDEKKSWYIYRSHAWFAGWAPAQNPELAVVVMVEHGGGGGKNAAPIAVDAMQHYFGAQNGPVLTNTKAP